MTPTTSATLYLGDALEVVAGLPSASVDAIVTDPPYGLAFMGRGWDHAVPCVEFWREFLRVAKPGAHLLAFGGTRTYHRLACAVEDAGYEVRDCVMWVYGSGFPKSLDVSKAIDKAAGAERETLGWYKAATRSGVTGGLNCSSCNEQGHTFARVTVPATDAARRWAGWGTALKPAWEPVLVARKPLAGTVAANVLEYGTGALNIDGCRVGNTVETWPVSRTWGRPPVPTDGSTGRTGRAPAGRWPANLIHDGSEEVLAGFPRCTSGGQNATSTSVPGFGGGWSRPGGVGFHDSGSAARFFYCAKASAGERGADNLHPTVKPVDLMRYLCRLVTPPGGLILDPFMGSGSTGIAAKLEGFRFVGVELEAAYYETAQTRIAAAGEFAVAPAADDEQLTLDLS